MLHLSFSNRFEILLDSLLDQLGAEQPGPFGQRQVVGPSSALRRKLELAVADREGVSANLRCDYLAQWLWQQIGRVVPVPQSSPFAVAVLAGASMACLIPRTSTAPGWRSTPAWRAIWVRRTRACASSSPSASPASSITT